MRSKQLETLKEVPLRPDSEATYEEVNLETLPDASIKVQLVVPTPLLINLVQEANRQHLPDINSLCVKYLSKGVLRV